jgi:hypothetical protein
MAITSSTAGYGTFCTHIRVWVMFIIEGASVTVKSVKRYVPLLEFVSKYNGG